MRLTLTKLVSPTTIRTCTLCMILCVISQFTMGGCGGSKSRVDPPITLLVSDSIASESGGTGSFTVKIAADTPVDLDVPYSVTGTATSGSDFLPLSGTVTVPATTRTATILITAINDSLIETDETVVVTLGALTGYVVSQAPATITIANDDFPTATLAATVNTATESGTPGEFTITLDSAALSDTTLSYTVAGSATPAGDYAPLSGSVTIPQGGTTGTVAIIPVDGETSVEPLETVSLTLTSGTGYTLGATSTATVTIIDNDAPVATIAATTATATEGGTAGQFTISLSTAPLAYPITVNYSVAGSATTSDDYAALPGTITLNSGTTATLPLSAIDDADIEFDETVIVTLTAANATEYTVGIPDEATVTLISDETPTVTLSATDADADERGKGGEFTVALNTALATDIAVSYSIGGSAMIGGDYDSLSGILIIPALSTSETLTIAPILDFDDTEGSETVFLTITPSTGYTVGTPASATVTIADYAVPAVTVTATDATATEAGLTTGLFTVDLTSAAGSDLMVYYSITGTAVPDGDYISLTGSLTITAGTSTGTITLTPLDDTRAESDETVTITLYPHPAGEHTLGLATSATVTISSDD